MQLYIDNNFLIVYAYQKPIDYKYNINIIEKHQSPIRTVYEFDKNGNIFYNEINTNENVRKMISHVLSSST